MSDETPPKSSESTRQVGIVMVVVTLAAALCAWFVFGPTPPATPTSAPTVSGAPTTSGDTPPTTPPASDAASDAPDRDVLEALQRRYAKGVKEKDDRRVAAVRDELQLLLEKHPRSADLHAFLAQILIHEERLPAAYEQLLKSLQFERQQPELHLLAATVAMQLKEHDKAIEHYTMATGLSPRSSRYLVHLANAYLLIGRTDQARDTFLQALSVDSSAHQAYKGLSDIFAQQNKIELALQQIQKAIDQTPANQRPLQVLYIRHRAGLLRRGNRPSDALLLLKTLSGEERKDEGVLRDLAVTWALLEQPVRAAEEYESVMPDRPMDPSLLAAAAHWRIKAGDAKKAGEHVEVLRRIAPSFSGLRELEDSLRKKE